MKKILLSCFLLSLFSFYGYSANETNVYLKCSQGQTSAAFGVQVIGLSQLLSVSPNECCTLDYVMGDEIYFTVHIPNGPAANIPAIRFKARGMNGKTYSCTVYVYIDYDNGGAGDKPNPKPEPLELY